uniref:Uncharacterized protein n=1 Tax=Globisporangium ultimum (strain ATCC 200006 / CBS 805.95 / DAOM BR144) TaxID=431595 RepID=K3WYL7_GLOUD
MGQVYEPSLQEKAQVALEGRWGFYLEMTNFVLSMFIFSIYIAELYDRELSDATWKTVVEILITSFFIFDL